MTEMKKKKKEKLAQKRLKPLVDPGRVLEEEAPTHSSISYPVSQSIQCYTVFDAVLDWTYSEIWYNSFYILVQKNSPQIFCEPTGPNHFDH